MKRLFLWALPGLAAGLTLGWTFSPAGAAALREPVGAALLGGLRPWDELNRRLDPHEPFLRKAERVDPRPLREQAAQMWADLALKFLVLDGAVLLISTPPVEIGDACLWQGVYAATAALEYSLSPTPDSKRRAERAFLGLKLLSSRGRPLARAVLPRWVAIEKPGRWYGADDTLQWKEDASVDGVSGWLFGLLSVIELMPERREEALSTLQRFADTVIDNGYLLRNSGGEPTRYGTMGGQVINSPVGLLCMLAALKTLHKRGLGERYGRAYERMAGPRHLEWAAYGSGPRLWDNTTTNHNIAHLALASALLSEDHPARWRVYAKGLLRLQDMTRKMGNSYWIYLADWTFRRRQDMAFTLEGDDEWRRYKLSRGDRLEAARRSMQEWDYPRSKTRAPEGRPAPEGLRSVRWLFSPRQLSAQPIPVHLRPASDFVWQRSPYVIEGTPREAGPAKQYVPLDFLAAYALGRAAGALSPGE